MSKRSTKQGTIYIHPASIKLLTEATWKFAKKTLWGELSPGKSETRLCKFLIREYYEAIPAELFSKTISQHYLSFCERILLVKNYTDRFPSQYIPHPTIWLNIRYAKGFAKAKAGREKLKFENHYRIKVNEIDRNAISGFGFRGTF